jgi:hypothetical protein
MNSFTELVELFDPSSVAPDPEPPPPPSIWVPVNDFSPTVWVEVNDFSPT